MLLEHFFHIPILISLGVVALVLITSIVASLKWPQGRRVSRSYRDGPFTSL